MRPLLSIAIGLALAAVAGGQGVSYSQKSTTQSKKGKYLVKVKFPVLHAKDPAAKPLVSLANAGIARAANGQQRAFLRDFGSGPPAIGNGAPYEFMLDFQNGVLSPRIVSVVLQSYAYTGGAHGNTGYAFLNFGTVGGKPVPLKLAHLFRTRIDPVALVSNLVIERLKNRPEAEWVQEGEVKSLKPEQAEQFRVTPRGLEFIFAPYEMGPYSSGTIRCSLSWAELKPDLDPNGPLKGLY